MKPRLAILAVAGLVAAALLGVSLAGADSWEKDFATGMSSPDSHVRAAAVKALDPSVKKAREYLITILEKETWYVRMAAVETLARAEGDALVEVKKALEKESNPLARDGIALALGSRADASHAPAVVAALKDKHPVVRRSAAVAIVACPTKECIPALIEAWEKEKVIEICAFYREALEKITGKFAGPTYGEWQDWWRAVEHDFVVGKKEKDEAEDKKAEEQGKKAAESTTVLRGVELNYKERGAGGPLFVLPEYGMNRTYLEKHLEPIESVARVFYIDLPESTKFKDLQAVGATGMPYYPIDKLVDAFDELRKERKQDQIAIMGHGMSGWIAMRYATRYPKNVSHLILVSTWTSGKAWGDGRTRTEVDGNKTKNLEQEHFAQSCLIDVQTGKRNYEAKDQAEGLSLDRMSFSCYFVDPRDSLLAFFWPAARREMGNVLIPEFDIGKEKGNPVPALILVGANPRALWTSTQDAQQLAKYYPNAAVVPLPGTNRMPMLEDHEAFTKSVKGFFKKFPFKKKMGK